MKNNFLTHKFLPVLSLFLLVLFLLCSSSFASDTYTYTYVKDDITYNFYNLPVDISTYEYVFYNNFNNNIYFSHEKIYISGNYDSTRYYIKCSSDWYCFYGMDGGSIQDGVCNNYFVTNKFLSYSSSTEDQLTKDEIVFSTYDICDKSGNVVFQGAPQVEEAPKVELMKATQVEEIPQQIAGILGIALPIFLTIFGILLVLYLIKSKNLLHL